jgi:hypothetical protein
MKGCLPRAAFFKLKGSDMLFLWGAEDGFGKGLAFCEESTVID